MKYFLGLLVIIILGAGVYLATTKSPEPAAPPLVASQNPAEQGQAPDDNGLAGLPSEPGALANEPTGTSAPDVKTPPATNPPGGSAPVPAVNPPASTLAPTTTPPAQPVKEFKMTARRFAFEPAEITVKLGDKVRLLVTSTDVAHGLSIPQFNVAEILPPGETKTIEFVADKRGRWPFACSVYCGEGHSDMKGAIIVE